MQVNSPQKDHRTGIDALLREREPHGFTQVRTSSNPISLLIITQPLSRDERVDNIEKELLDGLTLFRSQCRQADPGWLDTFEAQSSRYRKYVRDNIRNETRRTLPKTNERDRRNQPRPENIIGYHFGTCEGRKHAN